MEKPQEKARWAIKLGGAGSQEIARAKQTVLARLMVTQIWCLSASSVEVGWGAHSEKEQWPLSELLSGRTLFLQLSF